MHDSCTIHTFHIMTNKTLIRNSLLDKELAIFPREDLNPHKQIQSLPCYHYTTGDRIQTTEAYTRLSKYKSYWILKKKSRRQKRGTLSKIFYRRQEGTRASCHPAEHEVHKRIQNLIPSPCPLCPRTKGSCLLRVSLFPTPYSPI